VANPNAPANPNVFDQFDPDASSYGAPKPPPSAPVAQPAAPSQPADAATPAPTNDNAPANPFDQFGDVGPSKTSAVGAFARGAEKGVLPAAGSLGGVGAGAEAGAFVGALGGPVGAGIGGIAGGLAGGYFGATAVQHAQEWAVKHLPDSWQDGIGFGDRQARLDEAQHSGLSFLGGLVPYTVTMSPSLAFRGAASELPENATALQRLLSHPTTAKLFGGALMGGMEAGNEKLSNEDLNWRKVAVATVFGTIFNRPNAIGEKVTELGGRPVRALIGKPSPAPTLAQVADSKTFGPGVTESVFQGTQEQAPQAAMTAQENARVEQAAIGEPPEPDLHAIARQMEPEIFQHYDDLLKRRDTFQGPGTEVAEKHLAATEAEIRELSPHISAAYRRAADTVGTGTVEPEQFPSFAHMLAAHEAGTGGVSRETNLPEVPSQTAPQEGQSGSPVLPAVQPRGPEGVRQELAGTEQERIGGQLLAEAGISVPQRTIGAQRAHIAEDVAQKLIAAGRPEEEAKAAGQLIAARYVTRAGRFGGKLGTAEELYAREGAAIAGATGRALAPKLPEPEAKPAGRKGKSPDEMSLFETLAQEGGLKPDPELEAIFGDKKGPAVKGFGKLVRPDGRTLDDALRVAKEHGYLFDASDISGETPTLTPRDLLDRLAEENSGRKQYKINHVEQQAGTSPERAKLVRELEAELSKNGEMPDPSLADRAAELVEHGHEADVMSAYERAVMEQRDLHEAALNQPELAQDFSDYFQEARGKIRISPNSRPVITLMKSANASTFLHESGHQFLEELMRDAQHPEAPADLRDDAQTVRDWLGVTDDIKTRHHEKFARGFEQYLREGVAPSPELAGVFAKFRNWLLSIYQSLKGLGNEISPDIRAVFDRMLEQEPQRTVVAPEREPGGPQLHEVHEGDATHAEPHEAEALADRAMAERARYIQEPPPEIAHEIAAEVQKVEAEQAARAGVEPGAETSGGAGGPSEVGPSGGEPGPESSGSGVGRGSVPVGGGGGKAETESAAGARPDPRSKLGDNPGTALAPGPSDLFGARESPFTDRAGNIRVENLTTREDVAQAIRDSATENNDFIGDRRGVITDGQVLELADALGMDASTLSQRRLGQAFNAEQIVAARKLLIQSATNVAAAMKKAAIGTDEDVMAYAEAKDRHQMIQAQVAGITAEAGRALRAFRDISGEGQQTKAVDQFIKEATGKTLFQLRAEAKLGAQLETPQQVSKFMNDAGKHSFGRIVLEYWINGLISGPATHATYMVGNTISAIMKIPESAAGTIAGRIATALGREGTGIHMGEAGALFRGAMQGIAPAIKSGLEAARTGITTELPGEGPNQASLPFQPGAELARGASFDETATFHDAMATAFGLVRGMRDTVMSTAALLSAGGVPGESGFSRVYSPTRATPNIAYRGVTVLPTGDIATLPSRGVAVIHSFFRSLVFSMEKNAIAYRQAANEGLDGAELHARVAQLRQDPSQQAMNEAAAHEATETALMGKGSELLQRLAALTNVPIGNVPLIKFIDPFVRVSGNIISQSLVKRTPFGLASLLNENSELGRDLRGLNGNVSQDKAIGRMMMGTALAVTFGSLAAQRMLSGSGPKDPKEARVWMMAGNQPHSVRIGDTWYQVNKLGPMGMLASLSADLYDVAHEAAEGEFTKAGAHLLHAVTQNVLDESAMHGPAELLKAIETPDRYGESYVRNYLAAFVPFSVGLGQMARGADPYQRDTRTMIDTIRNKIPGHLDNYFDHELPVRRDIWGEPLPSREALGGAGISAIYEQKINNDPVNHAMWKVGVFPGTVERKIHNVQLTPEQYDDFARLAGRMAKMRLDKMVVSPQFQSQTPSVQHDWMMEVIKQSRESARQMVMIKNPTIIRDAHQQKTAKRQAINERNPDE
jgi:hypothetical protein